MATAWTQHTVAIRVPAAIAVVAAALVAGSLIGVNLPYGSHPLTVTRGMAYYKLAEHSGTFQADRGGVSALIPGEVAWVGRDGTSESGSLADCLRRRGDEAVTQAQVEAGYAHLRHPDGGGSLIVGWIRCL